MSNAKRLKIETIFELCEEPKIWWTLLDELRTSVLESNISVTP